MDYINSKIYENKEFIEIIDDIINNETVLQMKNYAQHFSTNCFEHCFMSAYYTYLICKKFKLNYISATRAAMLHDLFLYDWRKRQNNRKGLHAFTHGRTAYENASKIFDLDLIQKDMIIKHMWPVTLSIPKYKETFILTLVDKYCATNETLLGFQNKYLNKKAFRYAYVFLSLLIIRI